LITVDPDIDFAALFSQFDTAVLGRKTFLATLEQGGSGAMPGLDVVVFSRTLRPSDYRDVSIVNSDPAAAVRSLKAREGKDIWLYGGGELFLTLLEGGVVDTVEPDKSGIVLLEYAVTG
jgi:dihydrofolate reductase